MEWKKGISQYLSGETLYLGPWVVGYVEYNGLRPKDDMLRYVAECKLPGVTGRTGFSTAAEAKTDVESAVKRWLSRLPIDHKIANYQEPRIMKFRKKPVVIEAAQYDGTNESIEQILNMGGTREIRNRPEGLYIETLEGIMRANIGDWIIRGVKGELYPCKPDIFEATYEPVR
jgi:hypothetical protein